MFLRVLYCRSGNYYEYLLSKNNGVRYSCVLEKHFTNVGAFLAGVVIYTVLYCVLMYVLMMNDYEKNLISKPIQMVMQKIRRK